MAPGGFPGNAVWGSSPAIDSKRGQLYVATGNNYDAPPETLACIAAAGDDPGAQQACLPPDNHFDSIMALDLKTGAIRWVTRALGFDAWTVSCIPFLGEGTNCPEPAGPDFDFGQAPALFTVKVGNKKQDVVGVGQKSGQYWALDPDTGAVRWVTQAGPGGTAGGLQWGSAVDARRVYTADANSNAVPWTLPDGTTTTTGVISGIDAATGELLWQTTPPFGGTPFGGGATSGPLTTANGVVFSVRARLRRTHVRVGRGHRRDPVDLRQWRLMPVRSGHLRGSAVLGIGLQPLRHAEQHALLLRPPRLTPPGRVYPGYWWDHTDLTVAVLSSPNVDPVFVEAIRDAVATWADVLADDFPIVSLADVTDTARNPQRADIVVHCVPDAGGTVWGGRAQCGDHRCNNVTVRSDVPDLIDVGVPDYDPERVYRVALHELGHALGLGHAEPLEQTDDLMGYRSSVPEPDTTPVLSTCDLKALAVLFAWAVEGVDPYPSPET